MSDERPLWFIVNHTNDGPVTFGVEGAVISPYIFTDYDDAVLALNDEVWPENVREVLVVRPGPPSNFLSALMQGFPNTRPQPPDAFTLNSQPGELLSGIIPLTSTGAALADKVGDTDFWESLSGHPGALTQNAVETVKIALGLADVN